MRPVISVLLFIFLMAAVSVRAQVTCNGALGDPVVDETFGSGSNPGPPLAPGITNMSFTTSSCPGDGQYTIANSLTQASNCHPKTWHNVPTDHTGNPNGYMMVVNASEQPSIFFNQQANGLCPDNTYFFSAYVLNLITKEASGPGVSEPDIVFSVQTTTGQILATDTTGTVPNAPADSVKWLQYGVFFTTPANVTDVVVVMSNLAPGGDGNDLILDDITFRACGPVIVEGFSSVSGSKNMSICQGSNATVNMQAQVYSNGTPVYQWQLNVDTAGWHDMPGYTSSSANVSFSNAQPGIYQYRLAVANGSAITDAACRVYSPPLSVYVNPLPTVPPIPAQTVCEGGQITLTATGGVSYLWTGPGINQSAQNPLIINSAALANSGTYHVVAVSGSGCNSVPASVLVTVLPKIVPSISKAVSVCAGGSTQLSASGGISYTWEPSTGLDNDTIANPTATPMQTTEYKVIISNGECVDSSQTVVVTVYQNPAASAGNTIYLFEGQSAILQGNISGDNITGYYWTPATYLSDPTSLTPITTPADNITYTLTVTSASCGAATSSVLVRVFKSITIPNTFSPNGDGINDLWNIDALITYPQALVQVFDRYGQLVYQSTGYAKPWDGTSNGKPVPAGTYYYLIDLKNGRPRLTGWVLVVR